MLNGQLLEEAMQRACVIARRGPADTPNPQVGCVLVDAAGRIVAEGWHLGSGTPHAEIAALAAAQTRGVTDFSELTAVVTLEPCNHTGRTGPCVAALKAVRIGAVAFGSTDPGALSGGGAGALAAAGIPVKAGVGKLSTDVLRSDWLRRVGGGSKASNSTGAAGAAALSRPYTIAKWAQTVDGRAAASDGSSQWITGAAARADVHLRRAAADAIAVGTGTVLADDPSLTARAVNGELLVPAREQPRPVIFGKREIPAAARVNSHPAGAPIRKNGTDLVKDLNELKAQGINTLFVEGGPTLISALLALNLVDECLVYIAPALLGGKRHAIGDIGVESIAEIKRFSAVETRQLGDDLLVRLVMKEALGVYGAD
ncbi:bifunctional diaminohydroxyphosphoribosylaminopyrimidine deaminase/5-amino-6-(5-phosphoribosylamino)uracil reductase RibD [Canibacter zhoujuaniae]|uniref:bifunctional diaminohydroxyphosphoribosylaminopyrimidine deaminase/5-amino-6-(5-phosphoribosylamino)uracil reductase RibD n=1 Tax=Canibacter zhoujuaniae TaxID=2708343 RepID=UPI001FBB80BD|nr:bifunctional diaminohydroxyphosphoribosylaminopyrimidine deaminase/5-amino-6-(5-phosphoribosylamino)uracil reductase RibD [Canibacter zhoujuaniae]